MRENNKTPLAILGRINIRRMKMNQEKQREAYQKMLKKCPDILTPMKAVRWSPIKANDIAYEVIRNVEQLTASAVG